MAENVGVDLEDPKRERCSCDSISLHHFGRHRYNATHRPLSYVLEGRSINMIKLATDIKPTFKRTLYGSGYTITNVEQKPSYIVFRVAREDLLGAMLQYSIAFTTSPLTRGEVAAFIKGAHHHAAIPIIVGEVEHVTSNITVISLSQFYDRLGGSISSTLSLQPSYPQMLTELGRNRLPNGLSGKADDLFELYVHAGIQFLFQTRVMRYGQERLFQAVPDGLVLGHGAPLTLYDAKAYADGYPVNKNSARQFSDYVRDYYKRYGHGYGDVYAFLVVSGSFRVGPKALASRSQEMYAECRTALSFLDATELGRLVAMFVESPAYRQTIDWKRVFARPVVLSADVHTDLDQRLQDGVLPVPRTS